MTDTEIHAEAKRRVQHSHPWLTDEMFAAWLASALSRGASVVLQPDGCRATYPRVDAAASEVKAGTGCV